MFNTGKGSASRRDTSTAVGGPDWLQVPLVPHDDLEVTTRLLYDRVGRRARYQVEVTNPVTKELLALRSRPFHEGLSYTEAQEKADEWRDQAVQALLDPDPF